MPQLRTVFCVEKWLLESLSSHLAGVVGAGVNVVLFSSDKFKTPRILLSLSSLRPISHASSPAGVVANEYTGSFSATVETQRDATTPQLFDIVGLVRAALQESAVVQLPVQYWDFTRFRESTADNTSDPERKIDAIALTFDFNISLQNLHTLTA